MGVPGYPLVRNLPLLPVLTKAGPTERKNSGSKPSKRERSQKFWDLSSLPLIPTWRKGSCRDGDQEKSTPPLDRLFPVDLYPKILKKATVAVQLDESEEEAPETHKTKATKSNKLLPCCCCPSKPEAVPFPNEFQQMLDAEWAHPTLTRRKLKIWNPL